MGLNVWAATVGVEAARNPSGGPHVVTDEKQARRLVKALRRRERERAFGVRDVDAATRALTRQRARVVVDADTVARDLRDARADGVGTGLVSNLAQAISWPAVVFLYVSLFSPFVFLLTLGPLGDLTGQDLVIDALRAVPWLEDQLVPAIMVYPFLCAGLHDIAQTARRYALRREYLAWASRRKGQLARGTAALPEPWLFGAMFASLPARVLPVALSGVLIAGIGVELLTGGPLGSLGGVLLGTVAVIAGLSAVGWLQRWRLRRIALLHAAVMGPAGDVESELG